MLSNLNSFLSGCSGGNSLNTIDKIQCCIVLLQSLPCARHAVLEQLCDAFHESMHKYMVEMERKAQLQGNHAGSKGRITLLYCVNHDSMLGREEVHPFFLSPSFPSQPSYHLSPLLLLYHPCSPYHQSFPSQSSYHPSPLLPHYSSSPVTTST